MRAMGMVKVFLLVGLLAVTTACGGSESRKARHVEQGKEFMAERNYTKARLEFRNALQIDPKDAEVRALAGLAAENLGEYEEAVKMYRVAIAADETLVLPRARTARLMVLGGLPDEALELITPGLEKAPRSADLLSVRALVRAQQGDPAAARKDAEDAVSIDPVNAEAVSALAGILWRDGEKDEAVALLRKSVTVSPQNVELRLLLGRILLEMGKPSDAEAEFLQRSSASIPQMFSTGTSLRRFICPRESRIRQ
jgi:Flp pilus assembly protein TadD